MRRPPREREFFSIGEVCDLLGVKAHVLRYWETQFDALSPPKNRSGNRVYRASDIKKIALIQRLLHEEKYTIDGARKRLDELRDESAGAAERAMERAVVRNLRTELEGLLSLLEDSRC